MNADEIYRKIQKAARAAATKHGIPAPTQEYLTRHALESFLDRLNHNTAPPRFCTQRRPVAWSIWRTPPNERC